MQLTFLVLSVSTVLFRFGGAHFALTYPPARYPDYDFLDNVRTGGPCGVPNGELETL